MPTYDYECTACGHRFDELQSFSTPPLTKCPKCKKNKLQRLFGGGGAIIFKGSGFYETDYRSDSYKKAAEKDKKSAEGSSSSEKSSEKSSSEKPSSDGESKAKPKKPKKD
jgi:putative FmdB family regulatory protein